MARLALPWILPALLLAGAAPAFAQADDCDDPGDACPLVIEVDAAGFVGETLWVRTADEWANVTLANDDEDKPHTVTIAGFGVTLTAEPIDEDWTTVLLDKTGDFEVRDTATGKTATLRVVPGDSEETPGGDGGGGTTKEQPAPSAFVALAAVALLVALARRTSR